MGTQVPKGAQPLAPFSAMSVVPKRLGGSRIKMPLGTEVGLGPGHIVLDGDPALPLSRKGAQQLRCSLEKKNSASVDDTGRAM